MLVSSVANAADPVCKVSLDARPAFGSLVQAGLRFLNPDRFPQYDSSFQHQISPKPPMKLSAEAADVTVQFQGTSLKLPHCDVVWANIKGEDLNPPGKYYPVQLPVIDSTLIDQITFGSNGLSSEDVRKVFLSVALVFKLEQDQVNAWFDNRLWEVMGSSSRGGLVGIELSQTFPDLSVEYYIVPERTGNAEVTFASCLRISWVATPRAEPAVPGQPTTNPAHKPPVRNQP